MNFIGRGPWDIFSVLCKTEGDKTVFTPCLFLQIETGTSLLFPRKATCHQKTNRKTGQFLLFFISNKKILTQCNS